MWLNYLVLLRVYLSKSSLEPLKGSPCLPSPAAATCCSVWDDHKMSNHCLQHYRSVYPSTTPHAMTDDTEINLTSLSD